MSISWYKMWFLFFWIFITLLLLSSPPFSPFAISQELNMIEGSIKKGDTFSQSLTRKRISLRWIDLIVSKLSPFIDFRYLKEASYQFITDEKGELVKFVYEVSPTEIYEVEKDFKGEYVALKKEVPLDIYLIKAEGEILFSLAKAMKDVGEHWFLATAMAEVLAWKFDFTKDVRRGDRFKVVAEKIYKGEEFIQYGPIQVLEYQSGEKIIRGIRYKNRYYNEKGESLGKAFLKVPLRFDYVSSGFNRARRHPIMGGVYPHFGIDYAAPIGTPVWAVADGIVVSCESVEGFGKQVVLRHPNGYVSYYSHLSKYGSGMKVGRRVEQKQIIGYVGSTGFSTGPHLDYRLSKNNQFINPQKETFPTGKPIGQKEKEDFAKKRDEVMAWLNDEASFKRSLEENR